MQQLKLKLFPFLKVLLIFIISYILSCNNNLENIRLLDNDVFIPILLTLLGISLAILSIFYTFIPLLHDSIHNKVINEVKVLNLIIQELKENIVVQLFFLSTVILFSLMEGTSFFYNFLEKHNLSIIYNFCITKPYFYKILALCISLSIVCDILIGIFSMPKNKN